MSVREVRYGCEGVNHLGAEKDTSNPYFTFDPSKCIVCSRCVRACEEVQGTFALTIDALEGRLFELTDAAGLDIPPVFERDQPYEIPVTVETEDGFEPEHRRLFYRTRSEAWKPWGRPFTGDNVTVQFTTEPGGSEGQFLLLVSNGLTTRSVTSSTFELPPLPPDVDLPRGQRWIADLEETDDNEDGDGENTDEEGDFEITDVRNVAGPVEVTAGGVVSLKVQGTDEEGVPLPSRNVEWTIEDDDGDEVPVVGSAVGERLFHRFQQPGIYTVGVTGTDPVTELSDTDEIEVIVTDPPLPDRETVAKFNKPNR
jgi:ferredoxin